MRVLPAHLGQAAPLFKLLGLNISLVWEFGLAAGSSSQGAAAAQDNSYR
jgi:hypothetical protein